MEIQTSITETALLKAELVENPNYSSTVIADSIFDGNRITTLAVIFPRFILPEINTHRVFSRNSASSRARSKKVTIREVMENPFIPEPFTGDKKGMSGTGGDELDQNFCKEQWLSARDSAVANFLSLTLEKKIDLEEVAQYKEIEIPVNVGVHKQHANRLIEPFMWHTALITTDSWENFFDLRIDSQAQPEINKTAQVMKASLDASRPINRDYHMPFTLDGETPDRAISSARCARVSFRLYNGKSPNRESDRVFAKSLLDNKHMSPFEHIAFNGSIAEELSKDMAISIETLRGNFSNWVQFRKVLEYSPEML